VCVCVLSTCLLSHSVETFRLQQDEDVLKNTTHIEAYCIIHGDFMLLYKEGADWLPNSADVDTGGWPDQRERESMRKCLDHTL